MPDIHPPLKRIFEKLTPEHRGWIAKDITRLTAIGDKMQEMLETYPLETCTIEASLLALGTATAQVHYVNKVHERIQELSGNRFYCFPKELYDLRTHCLEQEALCMKLVYAIMADKIPKKEAIPV
jgi:hypothetical protein